MSPTLMRSKTGRPAGRQGLQDVRGDAKTFIDLAASPIWLADEHRIVG